MAEKLLTSPVLRRFARAGTVRRAGSSPVRIEPYLEGLFNAQINAELFAGYTYLAMANFFGRQCVAMPGCRAFYEAQVKEERGHAQKLMDFVSQRGGRVCLYQLKEPATQEWDSPLSAFRESLSMELDISQKLLTLHQECQNCSDLFACNLIESEFLEDQLSSVDQIARYVAQMEQMGSDGLSAYLFDKYLLTEMSEK